MDLEFVTILDFVLLWYSMIPPLLLDMPPQEVTAHQVIQP